MLHYLKFTGDELIYASENDPEYAQRGWYDHGLYPFVFDPLFREEDSAAGFGFIDVMKNAQEQIDLLGADIMKNSRLSAKKRYFTRVEGAVNEEEFADFDRDFIHVRGSGLGEDSIREIVTSPVSPVCISVLNNKIEELKETSGNRDFSQGSTAGGVTSGTAIAALQEAGGKLSRDMINASYRAFSQVCRLVIELIRQFYTAPRCLRILGDDGANEFISFDNSVLLSPAERAGVTSALPFESVRPEFDISVRARRQNALSRTQTNADALNFFKLGFFDPEKKTQALSCLEIMDIEEKEKLRSIIANAR